MTHISLNIVDNDYVDISTSEAQNEMTCKSRNPMSEDSFYDNIAANRSSQSDYLDFVSQRRLYSSSWTRFDRRSNILEYGPGEYQLCDAESKSGMQDWERRVSA